MAYIYLEHHIDCANFFSRPNAEQQRGLDAAAASERAPHAVLLDLGGVGGQRKDQRNGQQPRQPRLVGTRILLQRQRK